MKYASRLVFALLLVALVATPALAKVYNAVTAAEMESIITELGFKYELKTDRDGDPLISFQQSGLKCGLYFYNKKEAGYTAIQISTGFSLKTPPTLEKLNEWNRGKRYARAYLDRQGDPRVEVDLDLEGGVTDGAIKELFRTNSAVLAQFTKHIGFR